MSRTVYLNGEFVPEAEAKISIYDLSVMQSAAAFEMTRSFNGKHFKLREHLERLEQSCKLLGIPLPTLEEQEQDFSFVEQVENICAEISERNDHGPGEEHRLLIVVSPGCAPMYKDLAGVIPHPFLYIADFPLRYTVKGFSKYFTEGVHCVTSKVQQVPDACIPSAAKHRSRLHFHLAQMQAPAGTWPLMKDRDGTHVEAPGANIMMVWKKPLLIGAQSQHALPGISMKTVLELCKRNAEWTSLNIDEFRKMPDELWLTGTPFCMLPVVSLDGKPIGDGKPGPLFKQTLQKWNKLVGLDIAAQIIAWDQDVK